MSKRREVSDDAALNIGIVTTWMERGAAYVSRAYMRVLDPPHNVFIYARGGEYYAQGDPNWDGDHVTWGRRISSSRQAIDRWDFARWIRRNRLDVVLFNEQHTWPPVLDARKHADLVGTYVDSYKDETIPLFQAYDFLLCNTRRHHSVFEEHPQALYLPWGTDVSIFNPSPDPVEEGTVTFFHSSGMSPFRKGTDLAVLALREIDGPARMIIHSQLSTQQMHDHLVEWGGDDKVATMTVETIESDSRFCVVAETVPLPGLYHLGDVYVYPSRLDGVGLTVCEAAAAGLPVIATDAPPMNEFVEHGLNGYAVEVARYDQQPDYYWPRNIASLPDLVRAMTYYVERRDELHELKCAAQRNAEERFDWQTNSRELPDTLRRLKRVEPPAGVVAEIERQRPDALRRFVHRIGMAGPLHRIKRAITTTGSDTSST